MIYCVVGPTGVGKTKLSILLAKELNAEIINCDSMQIYKELNIGVAKIKEQEKQGIPHHMFDIVSINDDYSVYDYQQETRKIIDEISKRNKNIIIVGGTGLYLKALLYDYNFKDKNSSKVIYQHKIIGLTKNREYLYETINNRVDQMIKDGLLKEVKDLYDKNINTRAINTAIGYKELYQYFNNEISKEEAIEKIKKNSRNYAKRQYTFFKNQFNNIIWYDIDEINLEDIAKKSIIKS